MSTTPNWQKHSAKPKKGRGVCKGRLRASRSAKRALLARLREKGA